MADMEKPNIHHMIHINMVDRMELATLHIIYVNMARMGNPRVHHTIHINMLIWRSLGSTISAILI